MFEYYPPHHHHQHLSSSSVYIPELSPGTSNSLSHHSPLTSVYVNQKFYIRYLSWLQQNFFHAAIYLAEGLHQRYADALLNNAKDDGRSDYLHHPTITMPTSSVKTSCPLKMTIN